MTKTRIDISLIRTPVNSPDSRTRRPAVIWNECLFISSAGVQCSQTHQTSTSFTLTNKSSSWMSFGKHCTFMEKVLLQIILMRVWHSNRIRMFVVGYLPFLEKKVRENT